MCPAFRRVVTAFLRAILLLGLLVVLTGASSPPPDSRPAFLFFWAVGCPHCKQAKPFVAKLEKQHRDLRFESWEVKLDKEGRKRFAEEVKRLKIEKIAAPTFVCGDRFVVGFTKGKSERAVRDLARQCK